ncbi:MAG: protein-export chaperone SecB [Chitinophagales bacterium]|nr:protein-export chaperone SecB [Chitinophagales bacterium]
MQTSEQPKIRFLGVSIVSVDLKVFQEHVDNQQVDLNVDAKVFPRETDQNDFRIWMTVDVTTQDFWKITVSGFGDFEFGQNVSELDQKALINVNAPAVMFPYFRSFISMLTANCGGTMPTLTIPPQLFQGILEELPPLNEKV